jgi:ATP-dependent Clp protease ATP-binding subunit ClpA
VNIVSFGYIEEYNVSQIAQKLVKRAQESSNEKELRINFAVELRQKVADLLYKMAPGEFEKKKIA